MIVVIDGTGDTPKRMEMNSVPRVGDTVVLNDEFWEVIGVIWDVDTYRSSGMPEVVIELAEK